MAGLRFWAHGTTVDFDSVAVGGMVAISGPDETTEEIEITDSDSGGDEELIPGLRRGGTVTLECRYIPGDAGQVALREARALGAGQVSEVVITLPDSATSDSDVATITFDAFVTSISRTLPLVAGEPAGVSFGLKVTGGVTDSSI